MNNRFYNFTEAVKASQEIIGDGLLEDNEGTKWDCFNLMDYPDNREIGGDAYWCVGHNGSIGYTDDNGYNVRWDYIPA